MSRWFSQKSESNIGASWEKTFNTNISITSSSKFKQFKDTEKTVQILHTFDEVHNFNVIVMRHKSSIHLQIKSLLSNRKK